MGLFVAEKGVEIGEVLPRKVDGGGLPRSKATPRQAARDDAVGIATAIASADRWHVGQV